MKVKYLVIVSLILAVLTIGAVSASEDIASDDTLTVDDEGVDLEETPVDEIVSVDEEPALEAKEDIEHEVKVPEKINYVMSEEEYDDSNHHINVMVGDYDSYHENTPTGNITILIDTQEKYNEPLKYWDSEWGDGLGCSVSVTEFGLSYGLHNYTVKYSGDENYNPFEESGSFNLYYMDVEVPDTVILGGDDQVSCDFALNATGKVSFYIDDVCIDTLDVAMDEDGWSNWVRLYLEDYLMSYDDETGQWSFPSFGPHNYTFAYEGNYPDKNISGAFNLTYLFDVRGDYDIYDGRSAMYGDELDFIISLASFAKDNITLIANGETSTIKNTGGYRIEYAYECLDYGENNLTFIYDDGVLPKKSVTILFNVTSKIIADFDRYGGYVAWDDKEACISILMPNNATGNLTVSDFNGVITSVPVEDGEAVIYLSELGLKFGEYNFYLKYDGADYDVDENQVWFIWGPNVDCPKGVWVQSTDAQATITSPSDLDGNYTIEIYEEYTDNLVRAAYEGPAKSELAIPLTGLDTGEYYIRIHYSNGTGESDFTHGYSFAVRENNPKWNMKVSVNYDSDDEYYYFVVTNIPVGADGRFTLYIDGKEVDREYADYFDDPLCTGEVKGTWEIKFSGDSYYEDTSASGVLGSSSTPSGGNNPPAQNNNPPAQTTTSTPAKQTVKLTLKTVTVKKSAKKLVLQATLKINGKKVKGKVVKFKFNGKTYKAKTNKKGVAKVTIKKAALKKLKVGKKVKYQASYGGKTVKKTVKVKK